MPAHSKLQTQTHAFIIKDIRFSVCASEDPDKHLQMYLNKAVQL